MLTNLNKKVSSKWKFKVTVNSDGNLKLKNTLRCNKMDKVDSLLSKVGKMYSVQLTYQTLKLSVNTKLRNILRTHLITKPPVAGFCTGFDQTIQNFFFARTCIPQPSDELIFQTILSTSHGEWVFSH